MLDWSHERSRWIDTKCFPYLRRQIISTLLNDKCALHYFYCLMLRKLLKRKGKQTLSPSPANQILATIMISFFYQPKKICSQIKGPTCQNLIDNQKVDENKYNLTNERTVYMIPQSWILFVFESEDQRWVFENGLCTQANLVFKDKEVKNKFYSPQVTRMIVFCLDTG